MNTINQIPLTLYVHVPWCVRKCPYCDFNSYAVNGNIPQDRYLDAIQKDLQNDLSYLDGRKFSSIFIGGGTPTLFSPDFYQNLFTKINDLKLLDNNVEITIEANPGTTTSESLKRLRDIGINRISIGVQSWQDDKLELLQRIHSKREALKTVEDALEAGFTNINVDLMYGLPKQTLKQAIADLEFSLVLPLTHISWYQLTIEPGTAFYHNPPKLPTLENIFKIYQAGRELLVENGFQHYEISAFARDGWQCQHNLNYWNFSDYLGVGAGAHGKITDIKSKKILRNEKIKEPDCYIKAMPSFILHQHFLSTKDVVIEYMLNTLRLYMPIPLQSFAKRTLLNPKILTSIIEKCVKQNLMFCENGFISTTDLGKRFLNDLLILFMEENY